MCVVQISAMADKSVECVKGHTAANYGAKEVYKG